MKKRMLSLALAVGMTLTTLTGCGSSTGASSSEGADGSATAADPVTTAAEQLLKHSDTAGKEETVYVIADANGKANKVIVSEWLKNQKGSDTLKDQSNLKDVKNVKGDQDFTKGSRDELTWNAKGSDIYYQGTSDKQLPVDVTVTYKLNGKTVSAKDLDGASGKLTMVKGTPEHVERCIRRHAEETLQNGQAVRIFAFEEHLSAYKGLDAVSIGSREMPEKMAHLLFKLLRQADDDHIPVLFSEVLTTDGIGLAIMNRLSRAAAFTEIDADVEEEE